MAVDPTTIRPSVDEVAAQIRTRTRDPDGNDTGTFTDRTRPTRDQVAAEAERAARLVALQLGTPYSSWDGDLTATAKDVVAARAALEIERSYYGDGSAPDDAALDQLGRRYAEDLAALIQAARDNQPGGVRIHSLRQVTTRGLDYDDDEQDLL